jgi:hypothetical protein
MPRGLNPQDDARIQGRLWTPGAAFPDVAAWHSALNIDRATITNSKWAGLDNLAGHARLVHTADISRPPLATNARGQPIINLPAHGTWLYHESQVPLQSSFSVSLLFRAGAGSGSNARVLGFVGNSADMDYNQASAMGLIYRNSATTYGLYYNNGAVDLTYTHADGWGIITVEASVAANTIRVFSRGAEVGSRSWNGGSIGAGHFILGAYRISSATAEVIGEYGEMVAVRGEAGRRHRERVEGYMAWRWGVADTMAATHPYRTRPPLLGV